MQQAMLHSLRFTSEWAAEANPWVVGLCWTETRWGRSGPPPWEAPAGATRATQAASPLRRL